MRTMGSFAYLRRKWGLAARFWATGALLSWSRARRPAERGPDVLDRLRARSANERRVEVLQAQSDDLRDALALLERARSPFFGL